MDVNNQQSQSYWFVVREDQSNVIFSSNNLTIQNPETIAGQETRYIVDTSDNSQYIQIDEASLSLQEDTEGSCENEIIREPKQKEVLWDRNRVHKFLTWCLENKFRMTRGDQSIWDEIAAELGITPYECLKKYRNLQRSYMRLFNKKKAGKDINWIHYNLCEEVYAKCKSLSSTMIAPWEDDKIRTLLSLYIENIDRFRSDGLKRDIWKDIAVQLGTTEYDCYQRFKVLKRTYLMWLQRSRRSNKVIKWPYYPYFDRIFGEYSPATSPWNQVKIKLLLDSYAQMAHKFRDPKFQKKELWRDISGSVGESPDNCDRKFRNLRQTYLRLKTRAAMGRPLTKWRYYKEFDNIYENQHYSKVGEGARNYIYQSVDQDYVKQLLTFYVKHKDKFNDPLIKKKALWKMIGSKIGFSPDECNKKFRNLKQTYLRLAERKRQTGTVKFWPYYNYFEQILSESKSINKRDYNYSYNIDNSTISEIKKAIKTVCDNKEKDNFSMLVKALEDSNNIQRERNRILQALLGRST